MAIEQLKLLLPDYAEDMKNNLSLVMEGNNTLTQKQIAIIAYACALTARSKTVIQHISEFASTLLNENEFKGASVAFSIMSMNNTYYRFVHLSSNPEYLKLHPKLQMSSMKTPGIELVDFELASLAVSTINGCGMCIDIHEKKLKSLNISTASILSAIRIAAVLYSISATLN